MDEQSRKTIDSLILNQKVATNISFGNVSPIYFQTNENIGDMFKHTNAVKGRVLSVTGSGDIPLELASRGAEVVDCIDLNILTKFMLELKIASVKALSQLEFFNFYDENNEADFLNKTIYEETLRSHLSNESQMFWDYVYDFLGSQYSTTTEIVNSDLFYRCGNIYPSASRQNTFLRSDNFQKLQQRITTVQFNFINESITVLSTSLCQQPYNLIYLSNAPDYIFSRNHNFDFESFHHYIDKKLRTILTDEGQIITYLYRYLKKLHQDKITYCETERKKYFQDDTFTQIPAIDFKLADTLPFANPDVPPDAILIVNQPKR